MEAKRCTLRALGVLDDNALYIIYLSFLLTYLLRGGHFGHFLRIGNTNDHGA